MCVYKYSILMYFLRRRLSFVFSSITAPWSDSHYIRNYMYHYISLLLGINLTQVTATSPVAVSEPSTVAPTPSTIAPS